MGCKKNKKGKGDGRQCCQSEGHDGPRCAGRGGCGGEGCRCRGGCGHGGSPSGFKRRFTSRAEEIKELEDYLAQLEAEVEGAREALAELRAAASGG